MHLIFMIEHFRSNVSIFDRTARKDIFGKDNFVSLKYYIYVIRYIYTYIKRHIAGSISMRSR